MEQYTGYLREKRKSLFEENTKNLENSVDTNTLITKTDIIDTNAGQILIDMRTNISYEMGHITGSLNFPFESLRQYISNDYLPFPKESELVFICPFGEESELLAQIATKLGYKASSLAGGYLAYKEKFPEQIS